MNKRPSAVISFLFCLPLVLMAQHWQYVDPRIGSQGVGRTFPGPSMPFGMVKPGPDCTVLPNAGWAPMPEVVTGFSQTHVSGTGGGQKYGNILLMPFVSDAGEQKRLSEDFSLGYYTTTFANGIRTEMTTAERCAFYRFAYPHETQAQGTAHRRLLVDATHFLGKDSVPDLRERQQFVGAEVEVLNANEVRGFSRIRGGWNNGDAYTVYFALLADKPFSASPVSNATACLQFSDSLVNVKVGISYVSCQQARRNIPECSFDEQLALLRQAWETLLSRIDIKGTERQKRMFYTALYHTMLMPVDKTGENPKWTDSPYYDDYYAIWDTYRTSTPLITLIDPQREAAIVNSLLNIYKREGYMPDARSGDCNGRTQGGSNADVVVADAFCKGVEGIDYRLALEAMLKDGEADPGADHEKHGRGGLNEYVSLGYIPYGIDRAGNRTVEYAYDDYCIAQVARGLGHDDIYERYMRRSENWKNLWRADYEWAGMRGFIMPRAADGRWLDDVPWGKSKVFHPTIPYTPVTKVAPWHKPWWSTFFYEALSAEYSLSVPHDVPALIERCGGEEAFRSRLDTFFDEGHYNVQNEPSFLTPCLYHWMGRPDLSVSRVRQIVEQSYSDAPDGLPGNDDSGAMSSWLAFHMMGFYPNAGQSYYLLLAPMVTGYTLQLSNGRTLQVSKVGKGTAVRRVLLNGEALTDFRLEHEQLMKGGALVFEMHENVSEKNNAKAPLSSPLGRKSQRTGSLPYGGRFGGGLSPQGELEGAYVFHFTLNRQFRSWPVAMEWEGDTLHIRCNTSHYRMSRDAYEHADRFCWLIPADGADYRNVEGTFGFVSQTALRSLRRSGQFVYDTITWRLIDENNTAWHVQADIDRTEMWILKDDQMPVVLEMRNNPLGIDWRAQQLSGR